MTARTAGRESGASPTVPSLPGDLEGQVAAALDAWAKGDCTRRLWERDAALWTGADEADWLGWLDIVAAQRSRIEEFDAIAKNAREGGFTHALLLGMGGSSLCPEVLKSTFGRVGGAPDLHVLDSTDPAQVSSFESRIDVSRTLFIVSSKSGTTLEPNIFKDYFFHRAVEALGREGAGRHFIAVTDPGSELESTARADRFRRIFAGVPGIGGRYSALSDFGMVPAAIMGIDVGRLLERARVMMEACGPGIPASSNPGVVLGASLGALARAGRDKVTLFASPRIRAFGAWLEQLLAESTGKQGRGLIPIDGEEPAPPDRYGPDRVFVLVRLASEPDREREAAVRRLEEAGHPVIRIDLTDPHDLGGEFLRWEIATAVAGSILGINPFDQPDVEASKVATRELTARYEESGALPPESPIAAGEDLRLFTDPRNAEALGREARGDRNVTALIAAHLRRLAAGDYFGLLAYVERCEEHDAPLQGIRHAVRDARRVATCLGYGPRFLHSTGQAYKGGPDSGVFLQITCDDRRDRPVPGRRYTFGVVKAAQARGDFRVLAERGRRALRVHLPAGVAEGLRRLRNVVVGALRA